VESEKKPPGSNGPFLKYSEASSLLGVKKGTLYSWVSRGLIPFVRLSPRVIRFRRTDLEAWLGERSHTPSGEGGSNARG
jgi:excisionase family DNA binding protein